MWCSVFPIRLRQSFLLLPEPGQRLARGDGVEVEGTQRGGDLLGWGWCTRFRRFSVFVPHRIVFRDQRFSCSHVTEPLWRLGEEHLGAIGDPGR